ncbi:hypothetical protein LTS15_010365 [Exophiala xenobiotica]|nr:hypothetical protein LTS15_010365 [Exophiala xenobiotica]
MDSNSREEGNMISRSPTPEVISDQFVNVPKLSARLQCIFGKPVNCYWRLGAWHIENAPRPLEEREKQSLRL